MNWYWYALLYGVVFAVLALDIYIYLQARAFEKDAVQTLFRAKQTLLLAEDMRKEAWSIIDAEYFPGASEAAQKAAKERAARKEQA